MSGALPLSKILIIHNKAISYQFWFTMAKWLKIK